MFWKKNPLIADVLEEKCRNCGACVLICRRQALITAEVQGKTCTFVDDPHRCSGCGRCTLVCPNNAIAMIDRYA